MKKIFTFLVAFLATMSGAVWGQEHGSFERPLDISNYNDALLIDLKDCSGNYYITTNGKTNTYGIKVGGSNDVLNPANVTIYLINAKFDVGGSAIIVGTGETDIHTDIIRFVNLELVLIGENEITSDGSAAAIKLRNGDNVKLTISEKSTGILNINMTGDEPINQVAIGERGTETVFGQDALHDCGSLTINGGTIVTNGYIGEFHSHAFRMDGNGIVVAENIETSDIHENWLVDNGIYYEKEEDGQNALNVKGNVTISSPIPDENVYVGEGNSLTLGEGDVLDADKVTIDGGTLNAYKVSYDLNKSVGSKTITVADEIPYGTYYCGNKTALLEGPNATNSGPSWHNLGWANNTSIMTATPDPVPGSVTEAANQITAKAIWAVNQWTIVQVTTGRKMETPISLLYPSDITGISFEEETTGTLDTYGAKIEGTKVVAGDNGAGEANENAENVTLKIKVNNSEVSGKTTIIPFKVNNDAPDLSDENVTKVDVTDVVYSGKAVEDGKVITNITVNEISNLGTELFVVKYSSDAEGSTIIDAPTNQGTYYVFIQAKEGATNYQNASKPQPFNITPKEITTVTTEPEQIDLVIGDEESAFSSVKFSSTDIYEVDKKTVTIKATAPTASWEVPGIYSIVYSDFSLEGNELGNYTLDSGVTAKGKAKVSISGDEKPIDPGVPDEEDDEDVTIRVNGDGWTVADGAYQHVYTGAILSDALKSSLEAKQVKTDGTYEWKKIPAEAITEIEITSYKVDESSDASTAADEVKNAGLYSLTVTIDSDKAEGLLYDGVVSPLPVRVTPRDLSINFPLDDVTEDNIGQSLDPNSLYWEDETENVEDAGLVNPEEPTFSGYIRIAGTTNDAGNYDVYYKIGIEDEGKGDFLKINYNPAVSINGQEIKLGEEGETELPGEGIEIDDDNNNSGSGITTRRYQLYLANKDYTFPDAKEDYAAEGLELFSRHNKKYVNAGGSFTVWYEHDGVANDGGYRIFIRRGRTGDYQEVKFDEVSKYYQIRNVQSDIYVRIYAADGFPVANEEITATEARAYAQPNKIVVITPQPTDVQIISMAGAVVATDKVTGQREFANLTEGVYIVRMGETVVKLQVRK